ncbi:Gfo/Idh/MocA family oxidoreductase [uncultured Pseudodesulfovibrio sp.]|uniref:Gfo/Idh/MocA family protein n=1 Tax=uncultured Pseudodesulfovibrio sp. TaxID=2035858 RepID=UPI0029C95F22|nr:Gfo/Idh/MocA family oxidoreductase [uncultured Pseudodesulfovibrio sp.]
MNALIIGYGSIGARHARLLESMGHKVACVTRNKECPFPTFPDIQAALEETKPWLAVVCTATVEHAANLKSLLKAGFKGRILVEKPLFERVCEIEPEPGDNVFVAYNLRFHPLVTRTRELLAGHKILSARFAVGQYLPDWRPGQDYTKSYSASRARGGGVLRDLSHELDLAQFLLGNWKRVTAMGGHYSDLVIDSDDQFAVLMETERCPVVGVHMDYLSRSPHRGFDITCADMTLRADFLAGMLTVDGTVEEFPVERDTTYRRELEAMAMGDPTPCTYAQGAALVELIEALEQCAEQQVWVSAS